MKFYRLFSLLVFLCFCKIDGWCTQPRRSTIYIQYSENGEYYYRSIPFSRYPNKPLGKTIVYRTGSKQPIYELNRYLDRNGYLSDDGNTIVLLQKYIAPAQYMALDSQQLVQFFRNGVFIRSLNFKTLITENRLAELNRQGYWLRNSFVHKDSLYLFNAANQVIVLYLNVTSPEQIYDGNSIKKQFALGRPKCKSTIEELVYPCNIYYRMPALANGNELQEELKDYLRKEAAKKNIADSVDQVSYSILVNRSGKCILHSFEPQDKRLNQFKSQITKWVAAQKVDPNRIPVQAEQWLFEGYLRYD